MLHLSTYCRNSFKHLSPSDKMTESTLAIVASSKQQGNQLSLVINRSKLPNCWSRKNLLPYTACISRVNGICNKSFCSQKKRVTSTLFLRDTFNGNVDVFYVYKLHHSDVNTITPTSGWHSELNSLQNVYFGFFIF